MARATQLHRLAQRLRRLSPRGKWVLAAVIAMGGLTVVGAGVLLTVDRSPERVSPAAIVLANQLYQAGEFSAAAGEIEKASEDKAPNAQAQFLLGRSYTATSDFDAAEHAYRASLELDADQPEARYQLALLLANRGRMNEAITELMRLTDQEPGFSGAILTLADLEVQDRRFDDARAHYGQLLSLKPQGVDLSAVRAKLNAVKESVR